MQNEVLRTLCILSATGAVLTLAVYAIAPLARRFLPARWLKNAATLVLLAYALPVWLALPPLSALLPAQSAPQAQDTPPVVTETVQTMQAEPVQTAAAPEQAQQPVPVVHDEAAAQPRQFPTGIVLAVWGAGAAVMLCRTLVSYAVFRHRLKAQSEPVEVCALLEVCRAEVGVRRRVRLYRTALVRAPALAGLLHPAILLPWGDFSADDLRAALLHELHHLKSRDLARKWLAALVQCAHWWNPFAYLAARLLHQSCETACDLAVTGRMDSAGRAAYMKAVLAFAAAGVKAPPLTTSMSAGGREIERRFIMIARQKPVKLLARLTALALTAGLLVSGLGVGALALNASEGKLETHPNIEIHDISSAHFTLDLSSGNYPDWLNQYVGDSKQCSISIRYASVRDTAGYWDSNPYVLLQGDNGTLRMDALSNGHSDATSSDAERYGSDTVAVFRCSFRHYGRAIDSPYQDNGENINITFPIKADGTTDYVYTHFCTTAEQQKRPHSDSGCGYSRFSCPNTLVQYTGGFDIRFLVNDHEAMNRALDKNCGGLFGDSETNFQNVKVPGIDISLQSASENAILFRANIQRSEPVYYQINIIDDNGGIRWQAGNDASTIRLNNHLMVLLSSTLGLYPETGVLASGKTYRTEIALMDAAGSVIYRQLEHVTIP